MWEDFWNLRVNDRLARWREFRKELDTMPFEEALKSINDTWGSAPFFNYHLDDSSPFNWPDPWTLLAENRYCDFTKALGMLYTIYFTKHRKDDLELLVYVDNKKNERYYVVSIDKGNHILNYHPWEIVNTKQFKEKHIQLLYQYSITDLKLEKY
jgi:hypothetical protein